MTTEEQEASDARIKLQSSIWEMPPEEVELRKTNLFVRLKNGHPTSHLDVLLLKRLLDEANEALENAQEKHDAEVDQLKDDLAHIRNYPDC